MKIIIEFYTNQLSLVDYFKKGHNIVRCGITNASCTKTFSVDFDFGACHYEVERVNRKNESWKYLTRAIESAKKCAEKAYREARPKLADIVIP